MVKGSDTYLSALILIPAPIEGRPPDIAGLAGAGEAPHLAMMAVMVLVVLVAVEKEAMVIVFQS